MVVSKSKTMPMVILMLFPWQAFAQSSFGMGDEQQQLQQLRQLQGNTGSTNLVAATPSSIPIATALGNNNPTTQVASPAQTALMSPSQPAPISTATVSFSPSTSAPVATYAAESAMPVTTLPGTTLTPPSTNSFTDITQQVNAAISSNTMAAENAALSQLTPVFTPYSGPSNRFTALPTADQNVNESAFNNVISSNFPMTTDQIHALKQAYYASQQAATAAPGVPPRPVVTTQLVSIAPGSTPPVVRLSQGFVSSLVFVDSTGAPWPIEAYDIGNPGAFSIQWNHNDNTLMMQAMTLYTYGNMAIRLKNLSTPVMLTLVPGQRVVDYRVDLRVQGVGPNAKTAMLGDGLPESANADLMSVLDGVPPKSAKNVIVNGGEAQAWASQDKLYVRTRLTLLSPAWNATMSSADGMNAYELQRTPMLLVSSHGKPIQLRIEGL